jgi:hypothetical protein
METKAHKSIAKHSINEMLFVKGKVHRLDVVDITKTTTTTSTTTARGRKQ